jgi:hypothetical protein
MSKRKDNVSGLLAAIQRQTPTNPEQVTEPPTSPEATDEKNKLLGNRLTAHRVQFYLHDNDRQTVRELSAWLAAQGIRASDSLVIRAALRLAKTGGELLNTYRQLEQMDGRYKQAKAKRIHSIYS